MVTKVQTRSKTRKRTVTSGKLKQNTNSECVRATKRTKRLETTEPRETDETKMGQSASAIRQRKQRDVGGGPDHLRPYHFQPGKSGNPKGRPKGALSLTGRLRKLLRQPAYANEPKGKTKGDVVVEMAIQAAAQGDANFFKEIMNRIDGKVSDHVILDSAKRIVEQEAADVSAAVVEVVFEIVDKYIGDESEAAAFITELGDKLTKRLGVPPQLEASA